MTNNSDQKTPKPVISSLAGFVLILILTVVAIGVILSL
jgi:hypothetical protein